MDTEAVLPKIGLQPSLPSQAASVFRALRLGRHVCQDDGDAYYDLQRHEEAYTALFAALGYPLNRHEQGFYYFTGESILSSKRLKQATLFMLVLFQELDDNKFNEPERAWERTLLDRRFMLRELPHFATAHRRALMNEVGLTADDIDRVLNFLQRLGVVEAPTDNAFHFKPPVYRFVEMFLQFADDKHWSALLDKTDDANGEGARTRPDEDELIDDVAGEGDS